MFICGINCKKSCNLSLHSSKVSFKETLWSIIWWYHRVDTDLSIHLHRCHQNSLHHHHICGSHRYTVRYYIPTQMKSNPVSRLQSTAFINWTRNWNNQLWYVLCFWITDLLSILVKITIIVMHKLLLAYLMLHYYVAWDRGSTSLHMRRPCLRYQL